MDTLQHINVANIQADNNGTACSQSSALHSAKILKNLIIFVCKYESDARVYNLHILYFNTDVLL